MSSLEEDPLLTMLELILKTEMKNINARIDKLRDDIKNFTDKETSALSDLLTKKAEVARLQIEALTKLIAYLERWE